MTFKASSWLPPVKNITPCVSGPASNPRAGDRRLPAVDMSNKITRNRSVVPPHGREMPPSSGKPPANWPKPAHGPFASGAAVSREFSKPSKSAPSR
jgi:hypothetical protein